VPHAAGERLRHIQEEIDYVAAYLVTLDPWYIIPAGVVALRKGNIWLAPWRGQNEYERYLEAWHLLRRWRGGKYARKSGKGKVAGEEPTVLRMPCRACDYEGS
jgi:hypothetical protein